MAACGGTPVRGGVCGVNVPVADLRRDFEAIVLAGGACAPRDLTIPGRELGGIHFAMDYLTLSNKRCEGDPIPDEQFISAGEYPLGVAVGGGYIFWSNRGFQGEGGFIGRAMGFYGPGQSAGWLMSSNFPPVLW